MNIKESIRKGKLASVLMWLSMPLILVARIPYMLYKVGKVVIKEASYELHYLLLDLSEFKDMAASHWKNKRCRHDNIVGYCRKCGIEKLTRTENWDD